MKLKTQRAIFAGITEGKAWVRYLDGRLVVTRFTKKAAATKRPLTFRERFMWRLCRRVPKP